MIESSASGPAVLPDLPATKDMLGFAPYANTLRDIILNPKTRTPLTVGIFGSWGSGKTSLMKMVELELRKQAGGEENGRQIYPIWFNAWLYSKEESLWRSMIVQVLAGVRKLRGGAPGVAEQLKALEEQLYRAAGPSDLGTMSITAADLRQNPGRALITLALQQGVDLMVGLGETAGTDGAAAEGADQSAKVLYDQVQSETAKLTRARVEALERFQTDFARLVRDHIENFGLLVVFVDDLDRCLPEKAVEVLEAIKLFLDVPGCIFVLGIDREVVARGIRIRYGEMGGKLAHLPTLLSPTDVAGGAKKYRAFLQELLQNEDDDVIDGGRYLEKIIQIPFTLPPISEGAMGRFILDLDAGLPHSECGRVFTLGLEPNPRQVKRTINIFSLLWRLAENMRLAISPVRLAKLVVIQQRHGEVYERLRKRPGLLLELETYFRQQGKDTEAFQNWERQQDREISAPVSLDDDLAVYEELEALGKLLTIHPLEGHLSLEANFVDLAPEEIESYVFLSRTAGESVAQEAVAKSIDKEAAPAVDLPAGIVSVESGLDERSLGYIRERTYQTLNQMAEVQMEGETFPPELQRDALNILATAGSEFYLQMFGDPSRQEQLSAELTGQTAILARVGEGDRQIPWEILYDRPLASGSYFKQEVLPANQDTEPVAEGFWGFRHVIERPLMSERMRMAKSDFVPSAPAEIPIAEAPRVLLVADLETDSIGRVVDLYEGWQQEGLMQLRVVENHEELVEEIVVGDPNVVVFHGRAGVDGTEAWIGVGKTRLTERLLTDLDARRGSRIVGGPARLFYLDVAGGLGRDPGWGSWLEMLAVLFGGLGVVGPMAQPDLSWSPALMDRFMRAFLGGQEAGVALREARVSLWEETGNPLGLFFGYFGHSALRLVQQEAAEMAA